MTAMLAKDNPYKMLFFCKTMPAPLSHTHTAQILQQLYSEVLEKSPNSPDPPHQTAICLDPVRGCHFTLTSCCLVENIFF